MKSILTIFVILLVLLLIISTLGGSIRTNERFNEEQAFTTDEEDYIPIEKKYAHVNLPQPKAEIVNEVYGTSSDMNVIGAPLGKDDIMSADDALTFTPPVKGPKKDEPIIEGYENTDFYAPAP